MNAAVIVWYGFDGDLRVAFKDDPSKEDLEQAVEILKPLPCRVVRLSGMPDHDEAAIKNAMDSLQPQSSVADEPGRQ